MGVLCLGESIVDLVCEQPVSDFGEAEAFVPRCGGAIANAAVVAARCGAQVSLGGGAGADAWGEWLIAALPARGFDPDAVADALPAAVSIAARSTEGWGAIDALPQSVPVS